MDSRIEMLAKVSALSKEVGRPVRLLPTDEIIKVGWSDQAASLLVRRFRVREYKYQTCFDSAELVLFAWTRTDTGWQAIQPMRLPDTDFTPYKRQEIGTVRDTPEAIKTRLEWEALCHKPGSDSRLGGRDSFSRCTTDESPMDKSWEDHRRTILRSTSQKG